MDGIDGSIDFLRNERDVGEKAQKRERLKETKTTACTVRKMTMRLFTMHMSPIHVTLAFGYPKNREKKGTDTHSFVA